MEQMEHRNKYKIIIVLLSSVIMLILNHIFVLPDTIVKKKIVKENISRADAQEIVKYYDIQRKYHFETKYVVEYTKTWVPFYYAKNIIESSRPEVRSQKLFIND